ncbi:bifunctional UDP-sugar hydrolase/5'-nucleotidase [Halanaerobium sp. ST460_2HS_T2]|uniref:bifunctional metallophosphatase/5'-nucleotidase n=1 Tax=Halanaerobium sp. ST460_2HS_T2 TaxID=2183914 RepID=UPI000DF33297|nr:bifunctional metallophosphatase/5'-nucleotidase [Halanaerobium sp. ST460_2HS_T2]RCW52375.1 2',3'-cyclic-nucleotide 2'-phosphodiesterase (5'-nucleotidase family) [Halanaerobium sp. ST460_2HS_T2]
MSQNLTLLQVNDTHSYLENHPELFWNGEQAEYRKAGGYARIRTLIKKITSEENGKVMALDNGDTIHGTYQAVKSKGKSMIPILNKMGFEAMTAHWEFGYGPENFMEITEELNYPMLAINIYDEKSDELLFDPYLIQEYGNLKVGVIGVAATIVDKVMPDGFSEGIYLTLGNEELPNYIEELKEKDVDLIVVLSHLGFPQEIKLAEEVDGIDILLSGHTHNRVHKPAVFNDTIIIQSGCHGSFVGRLDLEVENKKVVDFKHQLLTVEESIEEDEEVKSEIEKVMAPHRDKLEEVLGYTDIPLNRNLVLESTMDNFLLDSLLDLTGADMAFSNGWRYGAPILPGPITRNDLWNIIPVNPPVSTVKLSGKELWEMMELNLERTFAADPYKQMGGYVKRSAGINLYFKIENPPGERIQKLFVQGEEVKFDRMYDAAFVTSQGVRSEYGKERKNLDINAIENLERYLKKEKRVKPELRNTIVAV